MTDVAVVIPAYQAGRTLRAALGSVLTQTLMPAEVIVVDDASSDETEEIAQQFGSLLPLRTIAFSRNRGQAAARNVAIEASASPVLAMLDADDLWLPDHLELMTSLGVGPGTMVSADAWFWTAEEGLGARWSDMEALPAAEEQARSILRRNFVFSGVVVDRSDLARVGGYRTSLGGSEDWDLWIRLLRAGVRVLRPARATVLYRRTAAGLTESGRGLAGAVAVARLAAAEIVGESDQRVAMQTLRRLEARMALERSHAAAQAGDVRGARLAVLPALKKRTPIWAEALICLILPSFAMRLQDRRERRRWATHASVRRTTRRTR